MESINLIKDLHFANAIWVLILPLALMGIDIVTGLVNAIWKEKNFQSSVMRSGLVKKTGEIVILLLGILFTHGLTLPPLCMKFISFYLIVMELMSILENLDKMGVPLPVFIKSMVNNVGKTIQNGSVEDIQNLKPLPNISSEIDDGK